MANTIDQLKSYVEPGDEPTSTQMGSIIESGQGNLQTSPVTALEATSLLTAGYGKPELRTLTGAFTASGFANIPDGGFAEFRFVLEGNSVAWPVNTIALNSPDLSMSAGTIYVAMVRRIGDSYRVVWDLSSGGTGTAPTIIGFALSADNTYVDVLFNEGVYVSDGVSPILAADLSIDFQQNGGTATDTTIASINKTDTTALTGGESIVRVNLTVTGTPNGQETIQISPADGASIYDSDQNAMSAGQTTGVFALIDADLIPADITPTEVDSDLTVTDNDVEKTSGGDGWNAGLRSVESIDAGEGWVEIVTPVTGGAQGMFGLSQEPEAGDGDNNIEFALYFSGTTVAVWESGSSVVASATTFAADDKFRVRVNSGTVTYEKLIGTSWTSVYTSLVTLTYPVYYDLSVFLDGATFEDMKIAGSTGGAGAAAVTLTEVDSDLTVTGGNNIQKTGGTNGWNAGCRSVEAISDGLAGYFEWSPGTQGSTLGQFGMTQQPEAGDGDNNMEFGLYFTSGNNIQVWEDASHVSGPSSSYVTGDRFRINKTAGGVVTYEKWSGSAWASFYTSLKSTAAADYYADAAVFTVGGRYDNILIG